MTRTGKRLIQDFIIPALESHKYGELLQWVDRNERIFQIKWSHKNAARWSFNDTNVFQDWDRLKGHHQPEKEGYYMQAKQRFRAALQKLKKYVSRLEYEEKGFKRYKLLNPEKKQVKNEKERKKQVRKVRAIPTPVICQNLSYNGNIASTSNSSLSSYTSSPSPSSSQFSDHSTLSSPSSELELLEMEHKYKTAQERQMRAAIIEAAKKKSYSDVAVKEELFSDVESSDSDQKENLASQTQKDPPPCPMESACNLITVYDNLSVPRFESPQILLVRTHYESRPHRPMGVNNVGCVLTEPSCALNLSISRK